MRRPSAIVIALVPVAAVLLLRSHVEDATAVAPLLRKSPPAPRALPRSITAPGLDPDLPVATAARFADLLADWESTTDPVEQNTLERELRLRFTRVNPAAIVRAIPAGLLQLPPALEALERWSLHDRPAALVWLSRQPDPTVFQLRAVVRSWTLRDPDTLLDYLSLQPAGEWKTRLQQALDQDVLAQANIR